MLYYIILCYIILYNIMLYYIILCYILYNSKGLNSTERSTVSISEKGETFLLKIALRWTLARLLFSGLSGLQQLPSVSG